MQSNMELSHGRWTYRYECEDVDVDICKNLSNLSELREKTFNHNFLQIIFADVD